MKVVGLVLLSLAQLSVQSSKIIIRRDTLFGYPIGQQYQPRQQFNRYADSRGGILFPDAYGLGSTGYIPNGPSYASSYTPSYEEYDSYFPGKGQAQREPSSVTVDFHNYNTIEQIDDYIEHIGRSYPDITDVKTIGHSAEGRPIKVLRIHPRESSRNSNKVKILVDAGIHAREWIAPAVALYMIQQLVENNERNRNLTENLEWHIVPLLNPDGYLFSMTTDRMWRKNRSNTSNPFCSGVDLNRNFDLFFGGLGTSQDPCDETYTGTGPFSEPETRALRDYALTLNNVRLYLTLHSFGQFFLYPWGFGDTLPRDWNDLDKLGRIAQKALLKVQGTKYSVGSSTKLLGAAAGGSDDWMKGRAGVKYSYTVELPGGGEKGFDLPPEKIVGVVRETWEGLKSMANYVAQEKRRRARSKKH